jgi:hypothetical protein
MIKGEGGCGWIMYHEQRKTEEHTEFWSQKHKAPNLLENKALCSTKLTEEQGLKMGTGFN